MSREAEHTKGQPGQKVKVLVYDNRIELIPVKPVQETRGFLKGMDTTIEREEDREGGVDNGQRFFGQFD